MEAPEKKAVPNMKQQTFSDYEYSNRKRKTRREEFLEIMDEIIPWDGTFVGINFLEEDAPDATTLLKFRRLLEQHGLNKLFFDAINRVMVETGHMLKGGTVVDATIINACTIEKAENGPLNVVANCNYKLFLVDQGFTPLALATSMLPSEQLSVIRYTPAALIVSAVSLIL